jgi:phage-related minor tail protein
MYLLLESISLCLGYKLINLEILGQRINMELSELSFKVDTTQLERAVGLLNQVQTATANLGKAQEAQSSAAASAADTSSKIAKNNEATTESNTKLSKSTDAVTESNKKLGKGTDEATDALKKLKKGSKEVEDGINPLAKLIDDLNTKYIDLSHGFTNNEAAILKQARSYGALGDGLKPVIDKIEDIRKLSANPLDPNLGAIRSIQKEFDSMTNRSKFLSEGISLTTNQLKNYSRIAFELEGQIKGMDLNPKEGKGLEMYNKTLPEIQQKYIGLAGAVNMQQEAERQLNNERRKAEQEQVKADRDAEKARLEAMKPLPEFNQNLTSIKSASLEMNKLSTASNLAASGINLTDKQLTDYLKLSDQVSSNVKAMQLDPTRGNGLVEYNKQLSLAQEKYLALTSATNAQREAEKAKVKAEQDAVKATENAQNGLIDALKNASSTKLKIEQDLAKQTLQLAKETAREQALIQAEYTRNSGAYMQQYIKNTTASPVGTVQGTARLAEVASPISYKQDMQAMREFYTEQDKLLKSSATATQVRDTMMDSAVAKYYAAQDKLAKKSDTTAIALREQERATKWLANEEERMISVAKTLADTQGLSGAASERAAKAIALYERNLRQAGITGEEATKKIDAYRKYSDNIQSSEDQRKGKFLARALQPQIGDTVVSMYAGQNPLTVILQQGDQVRGLIAQSGLEGAKLAEVMRNAFAGTAASIKDTFIAMGSVVGGAFLSIGRTVASVITGPIAAFKLSMDFSKIQGLSTVDAVLVALSNSTDAFGKALFRLSAIPIIAIVSALAMAGTAFYQVYQQEQEMSKQTILNGAAMGLTKNSAIALAQSMNEVGVSTYKGMEVLTAMIGTGNLVQADFKLITSSAIALEKAGGPAIDETVKMFSKLREKPVEALIDLARTSGLVAPQILAEVNKLATTGNMADAIALAMKTANDVIKTQAAEMTRELSALGKVIKGVGELWTGMMDAFRGSMYADSASKALEGKISHLEALSKNKLASGIGSLFGDNVNSDLDALKEQLKLLKSSALVQSNLVASQSEAARIQKLKDDLVKRLDDKEDSAMKKKLSMQEYINKALADEVKIRGKALEPEEVASVTKVARVTFDKLHEKEGKGAESKYQSELKAAQNAMNAVLNKDDGLLAGTSEFYSRVNFLRNKAKEGDRITAEQEKAYLDAYLNQQPPVIAAIKEEQKAKDELAKAQEKINSLIGRANFMGADYDATLKLLIESEGKVGIDPEKLKLAREALEATTPSAKALASVMADYAKTLEDVAANSNYLKSSYSTDFLSTDDKGKLKAKEELLKNAAKADADYHKQFEYNKAHIDDKRRTEADDGALAVLNAKKKNLQEVYDREVYLLSNSYKSNKEYSDSIIKLGEDTSKLLTNEFMDFAMFGKTSFEGLAVSFDKMINSMINNLLRFHAQQKISDMLKEGLSGALDMLGLTSSASAGSAANAFGGVMSSGSLLSGAKSWLGDFGGSTAKALTSVGNQFYDLGLENIGLALGAAPMGGAAGLTVGATSSTQLATMGSGTGLTAGAGGVTGLTLGGGTSFGLQGAATGTAASTSAFSTVSAYTKTAGEALGYLNTAILASEGKWGSAIGSGIGSYFGGPIGSVIGSAIGGWVDKAFGGGSEYTTSQGISGKFSKTGFSGRNYQDWQNDGSSGFFGFGSSGRSSGTNYSQMDSSLQDKLSSAFTAIQIQSAGFAGALGIDATKIVNYSQDIKLALGADASANKTAIENTFKDIANNIANVVLDPKYIKEGETASDALSRLANGLTSVNKVFDSLGDTLLALSQSSADSADKLITLMGGQQAYASAMDSYYKSFYTAEERTAKSKQQLQVEFSKLGKVMPDSLKAYRDLVNAQDVTTDSGRATYVALINLSSAFSELNTAQSSMVDSMIASSDKLKAAISQVQTTQLSPTQLAASLQEQFNTTYTAASSAQGADKVKYADKLAALLPDLTKALETISSTANYQLLIGDIVSKSTKISNQLLGIPGFASGGKHLGGLRIVGENGPELEATGPSRIFNATETKAILNPIGNDVSSALGSASINNYYSTNNAFGNDYSKSYNTSNDYTSDYSKAYSTAYNATNSATDSTAYNSDYSKAYSTAYNALFNNSGSTSTSAIDNSFSAVDNSNTFSPQAGVQNDNTIRLEALMQKNAIQLELMNQALVAVAIHTANTADSTRRMDREGVLIYTDVNAPITAQVVA